MITELLRKWFGLVNPPCESCEILRMQLEKCDTERRALLDRLLDKDKPVPVPEATEEFKPITPQFVPWRVRQQMMEAEDRHTASLLKNKEKEISDLEQEVLGAVQK